MSDQATIRNLRSDLEATKDLAARVAQQNIQIHKSMQMMMRLLIATVSFHGKRLRRFDKESEMHMIVPVEVFTAIELNKLALNVAEQEEVEEKGEKVVRPLLQGKTPILRMMVVDRPPVAPEEAAANAKEEKRVADWPTMKICAIHKVIFPKGVGCAQCLDDYVKATGAKVRPMEELGEKLIELTDKEK